MRNGMIEDADGTREWWVNGELHRDDGPAVENVDGTRMWWVNGKIHRTDGPAIEYLDGTREWWFNGQKYTFSYWLKVNTTLDSRVKIMLSLTYGEHML